MSTRYIFIFLYLSFHIVPHTLTYLLRAPTITHLILSFWWVFPHVLCNLGGIICCKIELWRTHLLVKKRPRKCRHIFLWVIELKSGRHATRMQDLMTRRSNSAYSYRKAAVESNEEQQFNISDKSTWNMGWNLISINSISYRMCIMMTAGIARPYLSSSGFADTRVMTKADGKYAKNLLASAAICFECIRVNWTEPTVRFHCQKCLHFQFIILNMQRVISMLRQCSMGEGM